MELNRHTGECIWMASHRSSLAKRRTSSRAWFTCIIRWSRMKVIHLFCWERGKNMMYLFDCRLWLVFLPPA